MSHEVHFAQSNKISEEEQTSINQLKEKLSEVLKDAELPDDYKLWGITLSATSTDQRLDVILYKFLKARCFNLDEAKEMLTNSLKWRKSFKTDTILDEKFPEDPFSRIGIIHKTDKLNRPVTYNFYGGLDNQQVFGDLDRFLRWRIQLMEKGIQRLDFITVDQMLQVHDYDQVSLSSYRTAKVASKTVTEIMQNHYPEFLAVKFFINVPWWGDMMFKFISYFLSEETKKKFIVTSSDVKNNLLLYITEENIPSKYGGKSEL
ncbi:14652_t:CDS:2 [Entrophospora sp. SA101]|nr:14652_t:CDS:2 [Entrophospora sp. SA101]